MNESQKFESNVDELVSIYGAEEFTIQDLSDQASAYISKLSPAEQQAACIYLTGLFEHITDGLEEESEEEEEEEEEDDEE